MLNAWLAIMRHRTMTRVRLDAAFRSVRAVVTQATRLGGALARRVSAGEVVTIGFGDVAVIADTLTITGPGVGAVLAFVVVAALLLAVEPLLAAVVLRIPATAERSSQAGAPAPARTAAVSRSEYPTPLGRSDPRTGACPWSDRPWRSCPHRSW